MRRVALIVKNASTGEQKHVDAFCLEFVAPNTPYTNWYIYKCTIVETTVDEGEVITELLE